MNTHNTTYKKDIKKFQLTSLKKHLKTPIKLYDKSFFNLSNKQLNFNNYKQINKENFNTISEINQSIYIPKLKELETYNDLSKILYKSNNANIIQHIDNRKNQINEAYNISQSLYNINVNINNLNKNNQQLQNLKNNTFSNLSNNSNTTELTRKYKLTNIKKSNKNYNSIKQSKIRFMCKIKDLKICSEKKENKYKLKLNKITDLKFNINANNNNYITSNEINQCSNKNYLNYDNLDINIKNSPISTRKISNINFNIHKNNILSTINTINNKNSNDKHSIIKNLNHNYKINNNQCIDPPTIKRNLNVKFNARNSFTPRGSLKINLSSIKNKYKDNDIEANIKTSECLNTLSIEPYLLLTNNSNNNGNNLLTIASSYNIKNKYTNTNRNNSLISNNNYIFPNNYNIKYEHNTNKRYIRNMAYSTLDTNNLQTSITINSNITKGDNNINNINKDIINNTITSKLNYINKAKKIYNKYPLTEKIKKLKFNVKKKAINDNFSNILNKFKIIEDNLHLTEEAFNIENMCYPKITCSILEKTKNDNNNNNNNSCKISKLKTNYETNSNLNTISSNKNSLNFANNNLKSSILIEKNLYNKNKNELNDIYNNEYDFLTSEEFANLVISKQPIEPENKYLVDKVKTYHNKEVGYNYVSNNVARAVTYSDIVKKMDNLKAYKVGKMLYSNYTSYSKEMFPKSYIKLFSEKIETLKKNTSINKVKSNALKQKKLMLKIIEETKETTAAVATTTTTTTN